MRKNLIIVLICLTGIQTFARTLYKGKTADDLPCSVNMNIENGIISFYSNGDGFGFGVSQNQFDNFVKNGQNPIDLKGGDGMVSAKLALYFDSTYSVLLKAVYKQTTVIWPKTVECNDLVISN